MLRREEEIERFDGNVLLEPSYGISPYLNTAIQLKYCGFLVASVLLYRYAVNPVSLTPAGCVVKYEFPACMNTSGVSERVVPKETEYAFSVFAAICSLTICLP